MPMAIMSSSLTALLPHGLARFALPLVGAVVVAVIAMEDAEVVIRAGAIGRLVFRDVEAGCFEAAEGFGGGHDAFPGQLFTRGPRASVAPHVVQCPSMTSPHGSGQSHSELAPFRNE